MMMMMSDRDKALTTARQLKQTFVFDVASIAQPRIGSLHIGTLLIVVEK
jgi:hypothetical protein